MQTMETWVDLLRHGEVAGGPRLRGARSDDPLTVAGSDALAAATNGQSWDVIATSPALRCHAFARTLAERLQAPLCVDTRLGEYDFGDWDGRPLDALWREAGNELAAFFADPDALTPPGGETAAHFRARVRAAWAELVERGGGGRVLVLGHGGVLRQFVADTLGIPGNPHVALEWPHAAMSRIRVFEAPDEPPARALAFHACRTGAAGRQA